MANSNTSCALDLRLCAQQEVRTAPTFTQRVCSVVPFVSRFDRDVRSAALDSAMTSTHTSNRALAATLGVSETIVRGLRNGSRPLRDDRIAQFRPRLRAAFNEALRGPVQLRLF